MERYKVSRYNKFFDHEDGMHLAFNALSGGFAVIESRKYEIAQDIFADPNRFQYNTEDKRELKGKLIRGSFLIKEDVDEIGILKIRYRTAKFSTNSLGLTIAPTMNCNFKCTYCYEEHNKDIMDEKVVEAVLHFVREKIKGIRHLDVTWFGGEPLLIYDVIVKLTKEFKKLCKSNGCTYSAGIITNGYLLSKKVASDLIKLDIKSIQITIDGPPEVHDERRVLKNGGKTFDVVFNNLKKIVNLMPKSIHVRINIDATNKGKISELLDIINKEGLKNKISISFGRVENIYNCANISGECVALASKEFIAFEFEIMKEMLKKHFKSIGVPFPRSNRCVGDAVSGFVIGPTGHLYKCWNDVGRTEKAVGLLKPDGFSSNEKLIRWLTWDPFEIEVCLNCDVLPICMGSCPFKSLYISKNPRECCDDLWKLSLIQRLRFYYEFKRISSENSK